MHKDEPQKPVLRWETLSTTREEKGILNSEYIAERAKVPGGWLVISQFFVGGAHGLVFLPDPKHEWDGGSLPEGRAMGDRRSFDNERLTSAVFRNCALDGARFEDVNLQGAVFRDVNLSGVTIDDAAIEGLTIMGYDVGALIRAERKRQPPG